MQRGFWALIALVVLWTAGVYAAAHSSLIATLIGAAGVAGLLATVMVGHFAEDAPRATRTIAHGRFAHPLILAPFFALTLYGLIAGRVAGREQERRERAAADEFAFRARAAREEQERAEDAERRRLAGIRANAPNVVQTATRLLGDARTAQAAGDFRVAAQNCQSAKLTLKALAGLSPQPPGVADTLVAASQLTGAVRPFVTALDALDNARALTATGKTFPSAANEETEYVAALAALRAINAEASDRYADQIQPVVRELARRKDRAHRAAEREAREQARFAANVGQGLRDVLATRMDEQFVQNGIEVDYVKTAGDHGTTLRIGYVLCGRVFVDQVARSMTDALRSAGFQRVECRSALQNAWVDL